MLTFLEWLHDFASNGLSWATVTSLVLIYGRMRQRRDKRRSAQRMEQKIDAIMKKVDARWDGVIATSWNEDLQNLKRLYSLLHKVIGQERQKRRKRVMERLKSRKLWVAIIASLLVTLNNELGWGFSIDTIYSVVGMAIAYILGQAHVDAKKAANGGASNESTQRTGDSGSAV